MYILSIETSCDDTSIAILNINTKYILSYITFTQNKNHHNYGGIIPNIALYEHICYITDVFRSVLNKSNISIFQINFICVTQKPGMVNSLIIGLYYSLGLGIALHAPVIGIHHLISHLFFQYKQLIFPQCNFVGTVISGGHSSLYVCNNYKISFCIGSTRDDSAGESFDKIGRIIGLEYPAGPGMDYLSKNGYNIRFLIPLSLINSQDFFFFHFQELKVLHIILLLI